MVSNQTLGALCILTGLHEGVQHAQSVEFQKAIAGYTKRLGWLKEQEYKCAVAENRLPGQFWLEAEPPKVKFTVLLLMLQAIHALGTDESEWVHRSCRISSSPL